MYKDKVPMITGGTGSFGNAVLNHFLYSDLKEIRIIGARHAEKMYRTLCGKEEMSKAIYLGSFYRIPADLRDLN